MPVGVFADDQIRCQGANADARHGLQRVLHIGCGLPLFNTEMLLNQFENGLTTAHMTRGTAADPDHLFASGCGVKLFIEADDTLDMSGE